MDSFELNKIIGAILGTLLFVMGVGFLAEGIYEPAHGTGPGYALPEPTNTDTGNGAPAPVVVDIGTLLAKADPKAGEAAAKKCQACHDFTENGPNKIGPNLYDVVERKIASHKGFAYSDALSKHSGDTWTYANLNQWLISPKAWAPGTKMTFAGDTDDTDRANIIAFLATLSHSPKPFPAPAAPSAPPASSSQAPSGASSSAAPPAASSASAPEQPTSSEVTSGVSSAASSAVIETPAAPSEVPFTSSSAPAPSSAPASSAPASPAESSAPASSSAQ